MRIYLHLLAAFFLFFAENIVTVFRFSAVNTPHTRLLQFFVETVKCHTNHHRQVLYHIFCNFSTTIFGINKNKQNN